jgi:hypothetical protein
MDNEGKDFLRTLSILEVLAVDYWRGMMPVA